MEYKCSTCNEEIDGDLLVYMDHTEKHIVDEIKAKYTVEKIVEDDNS